MDENKNIKITVEYNALKIAKNIYIYIYIMKIILRYSLGS